MRSIRLYAALLLGVALAAANANAQQAPTASHLRAAEQVLEVMDVQAEMDRNFEMMLRAQREQLQQFPEAARLEGIMRDFFAQHLRWELLKPDVVRLYTETFSEAEHRELHSFYQTPLGRKILEKMPQLTERSMELVQARLQPHVPELPRRIMEAMDRE